MNNKELVEELRAAVELVKKSGSTDANKAFTARASAIAKLLKLIMKLNESTE